jgi:hypothetical protein
MPPDVEVRERWGSVHAAPLGELSGVSRRYDLLRRLYARHLQIR